MQRWVSQLKKGLVELGVMASLSAGEAYGYQIVQRLAGVDGLAVSESTVYPLLARLTREGLVSVRTADSPAGPPRRYYRLTVSFSGLMSANGRTAMEGISGWLEV